MADDTPVHVIDDGKEPDALRTIGEVTRLLGVRQHVLRYWEGQFKSLQPIKRSGNRRYYRPQDVELIAEIDRLVHREGYTLRGARLAIEARDETRASQPAVENSVTANPSADLVQDLRAIRDRLAQALADA